MKSVFVLMSELARPDTSPEDLDLAVSSDGVAKSVPIRTMPGDPLPTVVNRRGIPSSQLQQINIRQFTAHWLVHTFTPFEEGTAKLIGCCHPGRLGHTDMGSQLTDSTGMKQLSVFPLSGTAAHLSGFCRRPKSKSPELPTVFLKRFF